MIKGFIAAMLLFASSCCGELVMVGADYCPACDRAKETLATHDVEYRYIDIYDEEGLDLLDMYNLGHIPAFFELLDPGVRHLSLSEFIARADVIQQTDMTYSAKLFIQLDHIDDSRRDMAIANAFDVQHEQGETTLVFQVRDAAHSQTIVDFLFGITDVSPF